MKRKWLYILLAVSVMVLSACDKGQTPESAAMESTQAETDSSETAKEETTAPESAAAETTAPETTEEETSVAAETSASASPVDETLYVNATDVNVRTEPSTSGSIAGMLDMGNAVHRIGIVEDWSQIEYNGQICYVSSQFLSAEKPVEPTAPQAQSGTGIYHEGGDILICIDAGHETHAISEQEPNGPGSSTMKNGVTSGTDGCSTGIPEYKVNLQVALKLRDELLSRGYSVVMTRETNDVTLSNVGRATIANESGADMMIRLHCNSADSSAVRGALGITQTADNPYCGDIYSECISLTNSVLKGYCNATGLDNTGIWETDTMTGTNWCEIPNTILEMGYMSNPSEDELLCDSDFQTTAAIGIADGIDAYFGR